MTIGSNLKKCRTAQGLTQEDLAQRLHVTRQTVSSWERNNSHPDLDQLADIAAALDTEVTVLLYGPERPARPTRRQVLGAAVPAALAVVLGAAGGWLTPWSKETLLVHSPSAYYYWGSYYLPLLFLLLGLTLSALAALGWRRPLTRGQRRGCVVAGTVLVGVLAVLPPSIQLVGQAYGTAPAWLSQLAGWLLLATYKGWLSYTLALLGGVCWGLFLSGERERI
ncbi:MAG TPA: helix-turn-helix domain-containing protein [Candidatus Evtepia faecigallinarum]|nr:helix-turn-helix domain-containing protein [Candidatus Evtepia faecigallinarum]